MEPKKITLEKGGRILEGTIGSSSYRRRLNIASMLAMSSRGGGQGVVVEETEVAKAVTIPATIAPLAR